MMRSGLACGFLDVDERVSEGHSGHFNGSGLFEIIGDNSLPGFWDQIN